MKKAKIKKNEAWVLPQMNKVDGPWVVDHTKRIDANRLDIKNNVEIMVAKEEVVCKSWKDFRDSQITKKEKLVVL